MDAFYKGNTCSMCMVCTESKKTVVIQLYVSYWGVISIDINHLSPHDASFDLPENKPNFLTTKGFRISMKLFYQYMAIFVNLSPSSSHLHPLQVENCDL